MRETQIDYNQEAIFKLAEEQLRAYYPYENWTNKPKFFDLAAMESMSPGFIFVLNIPNRGYEYISPNIENTFSTSTDSLKKDGILNGIKLFTEPHQQIFLNQILPKMFEAFEESADTNCSHDLRIKYILDMNHKNGSVIQTLHIIKPIKFDERGMPLLCLKYIMVLNNDIKQDQSHMIVETAEKNTNKFEIIFSQDFTAQTMLEQSFSNRELEIYQLIKNGLTSKEIAEKLFISIYTVNNHRKNILKKYESKNAHQIINQVKSMERRFNNA